MKALFLLLTLFVASSFGQSLSIAKKPDNNYWIQASAPADVPSTLQASENLHLWVDINSAVPQDLSFQFNNTDVTTRFIRLTPTPPEPPPIRVVLLGDSMVAECCGWGQAMPGYFKPSATVLNYAQAWTSTKVFLQSEELDKMLLVKPNYVLMQFGYSDYGPDPDRHSTAQEFADNLRQIIQIVRGFNGIPILITLHADRQWDAAGNLIEWDSPFNTITRDVAAEQHTPIVDLYKLSVELFKKLGQSGCAFMTYNPGNPADGLHVSPLGAVYMSQLIAKALPDELGPYLLGVLDPPPKP
jgi:lysophospholipase L1-like esterase